MYGLKNTDILGASLKNASGDDRVSYGAILLS